jgi:NAD(P)-dependent dehydrogenase (short-subunit alcohol dehydrogenase family)
MALLKGKVAVVTGASSGIGRATALELARQGVAVALGARREERLREVVDGIESKGGRAIALRTDVSQRAEVEVLVAAAVESFGRLDVMINNAGFGYYGTVEETPEEDFRRLLEVNLMGTFYGVQAALPVMRRQESGHIINVASVVGRRSFPFHGAYAASKFAVVGLTEALRSELAGSGIVATVVLPVGTRTEFFDMAPRPPGYPAGPLGFAQSSERVARVIVGCIRRPRSEVLLVPPMRAALALAVLFPGLADWVGGHYYRRLRRRLAAGRTD